MMAITKIFFSFARSFLFAALALLLLPPALAAERNAEYLLGPGDVVRVSVFQNPDLTLESRVAESGAISYPLVGDVSVGGISVSDAEKKIAQLLKDGGFVVQPQVTMQLVQIRGNQVAVFGWVSKPGRYPLETAETKLSDVLAQAGGVVQGGSDEVVVSGARSGRAFRQAIDLPAVLTHGSTADNIVLRNGDVVYVARASVFYIYGEVQRPGAFRLERDMTIMQALATGGGLTPKGTQRGLRIHRRDADGQLKVIEPSLEDVLKPDDVVYVKESIF